MLSKADDSFNNNVGKKIEQEPQKIEQNTATSKEDVVRCEEKYDVLSARWTHIGIGEIGGGYKNLQVNFGA